jgi:transcription initiation factor TFIID subunit 7
MAEEAYILRLPVSLSARVRELMSMPGATRGMAMSVQFIAQDGFKPGRLARVQIGDDYYPATLMDLPTVVETAKSLDGTSYYKAGHVGQVLVVSERMMTPAPPASYVERDGLTPPTRRIRDFWAANQPLNSRDNPPAEVERIEGKLKRIAEGQAEDPADLAVGAQPGAPAFPVMSTPASAAMAPGSQAGRGTVLPATEEVASPPRLEHTMQDLFGDSEEDSDSDEG